MATQAPNPASLPLLYNDLQPLNSGQHGNLKLKRDFNVPEVGQTHAIPVTVEEFTHAQRSFPIIFSAGDEPVPLALMGLNEGVNTFIDADGKPIDAAGLHAGLSAPLSVHPGQAAARQRRIVVVLRPDRGRVRRGRKARPCSTATSRAS